MEKQQVRYITENKNAVIVSAPSASSSRADSTSAAKSQNNVRCFAFCLGVSTANSGSATNSDSRTNSPDRRQHQCPLRQGPQLQHKHLYPSPGFDDCRGMSEEGKRAGIRNCEGFTVYSTL